MSLLQRIITHNWAIIEIKVETILIGLKINQQCYPKDYGEIKIKRAD